MLDGIYQVFFSSSGNTAEGIAVISGGTLNGGGQGYFYQGKLRVEGACLDGRLLVKKWDNEAPPALGLFKEAALTVTGEYDHESNTFRFEGRVHGHHVITIQATGRYVAALI